jgi:hypothetical protein
MRVVRIGFSAVVILTMCCGLTSGQSRTEKRQAKITESAKPKSVSGGVRLEVPKSYEAAYETVLNWVKRSDYTLDSADKDSGQIITAMTVKGGFTQTGTRLLFTIIKDSATASTVKVAVTEQKRKKLLQTEPWGDPKVNVEIFRNFDPGVFTIIDPPPSC